MFPINLVTSQVSVTVILTNFIKCLIYCYPFSYDELRESYVIKFSPRGNIFWRRYTSFSLTFSYIYFSVIFIFFYFLLPSLTVKYDPFEYIWYMMREKVLFIVKKMSLECICKFYLINEGSPVRIAFQQHTTPQFWVLPPYQIARKTFEEGILIADLNEKLKINFKVNNKTSYRLTLILKGYILSLYPT